MPPEELRRDLEQLKLPLVLLQHRAAPDLEIAVEDYGRLFIHLVRNLQHSIAEESLEAEAALDFSAYQMLYLAMAHSRDLRQAMQRAAIYFRRFESQGDSFVIEDLGDRVRCRFEFSEDGRTRDLVDMRNFDMGSLNWLPGETGRVLSMGLWHRTCSWFIGANIDLMKVSLALPTGNATEEQSQIFGCDVCYDQDHFGFEFDPRFLKFPIVQGDAAVGRMLQNFPAEILRLDPRPATTAERVRNLLGSDFSAELPSLQDVADRLHMTTPTLHRRLREEGSSFQRIKDEARRDAAINLIRESDHSGAQLAELTGFSDASTFHRAFKKWTGMTLQEYRQQT